MTSRDFTDTQKNLDLTLGTTQAYLRVGKKRAGRLLDGRTWDQMPGDSVHCAEHPLAEMTDDQRMAFDRPEDSP